MNGRLPLAFCRGRLTALWLTGSGFLFLLMLASLMGGKYGTQWQKTWQWFVPTIAPSLGLIVSNVIATGQAAEDNATVNGLLFAVTSSLSVFYLVILLSVILTAYFSAVTALSLMQSSPVWLGFVQGFVALTIGAFFGTKETAKA